MNEEYWVTVTSSEDSCDSDKIDSDIEAELYSAIHHETATARTSTDLSNAPSPRVTVASPSKIAPNNSPAIKNGSDTYTSFVKDYSNINVKEKSDTSFSFSFKTPRVTTVNKDYSDIFVEDIDGKSVDKLYTSFESPEVTITKDYSDIISKRISDASVTELGTSVNTPDVKVIKDCSNRTANKRKSAASVAELGIDSPDVKVIKDCSNRTANKRKSDASVIELETSIDSPDVKVIKDCSNQTANKIKSDVSLNNKSEGNCRKKPNMKKRKKLKMESERTSFLNSFECDSSDSDSIIWSEADECDIELRTNVEPEVVALSSDSFSDESFEAFEEICSFRGSAEDSSQPSTSTSSNDPWHINADDLYRSKGRSKSSRYHERAVLKCTNCKLNGHTVNFCTVPKTVKCYVCGGSHVSMGCGHKVCSRCFQKGHDSRFCRQRFVDLCVLCNMRGHSVKYCPDLWRRYHLTTTRGNIVVENPVPQDSPIYCFHCGEQGHYGAECRLLRPDKNNNFQTWTSVIAHVHPGDTIKRMMEDQRNVALGAQPEWHPYPPQSFPQSPAFPQFPPSKKKRKNKKKNPNMNVNLYLSRSAQRQKKKQLRLLGATLTPESIVESTNPKKREFNFPRTPKSAFKGKRRKEKESFMNGLHRRLGINSETGLPNNGCM